MAGVCIHVAGQHVRDKVADPVRLKPIGHASLYCCVRLDAVSQQQVFVEGAHQNEHVIAPVSEDLDGSAKRFPLE
jgi:hypothetical protein